MGIFHHLFDLTSLITPYLFHPLIALDIYVPRRWPYSAVFRRRTFDPDEEVLTLKDKVILVTGGSSGLGKETVYRLARHGPRKIYVAARSKDKAVSAIQSIQALLKLRPDTNETESKVSIEFLKLDLEDLHSVKAAADRILQTEHRLDILVLNAGIMATPPSTTKQGYDLQLGTNYIGHFYLTTLLLPLLEKTPSQSTNADVRVVSVSSEAHNMAPSNFVKRLTTNTAGVTGHEQLSDESPYVRYGISKAANLLFAAELARRCSERNITSVSLHPGLIFTELYGPAKDGNLILRSGLPIVASLFFDNLEQGALNQVWCAAGADAETLVSGAYYTPIGVRRQNRWTENVDDAIQLWHWTESVLKQTGFL